MAVVSLHHVQVAAPPGSESDARRFYGEVLGLEEIAKPAGLAARGGVWFRVGAQELHVGIAEGFVPATKAHPAFVTDSREALADFAGALERAGFAVAWADPAEIPGRARLHVADPFGNRVELLAPADVGA